MKKILLVIIPILLLLPALIFGQVPNLGSTAAFGLFSKAGALTNTGPSYITGNAGTHAGAFTGFAAATITGQAEVANAVTLQASTDVEALYADMLARTCGAVLGVTLGNDQVLVPNVYCIGAAATTEGNLYLDAQGNPDAIFIFKINGAFAPAASTNVILINKASMCNVFWQVNGEFNLGAGATVRGSVVVNGAINLYDGSYVAGRALSRTGAISIVNSKIDFSVSAPVVSITSGSITATTETLTANVSNATGPFSYLWSPGSDTTQAIEIPLSSSQSYSVIVTAMNGCSYAVDTFSGAVILPVQLLSFEAACNDQQVVLKWSTVAESNNHYYSIERSIDGLKWEIVGTIPSMGNSSMPHNYSMTDQQRNNVSINYRLKQTDLDGRSVYFRTITSKNCKGDLAVFNAYPNPARGLFNLFFAGNKAQVHSVTVYNALGKKIYSAGKYQPAIDLSAQPDGIYFLSIHVQSNIITMMLVKKTG